MNRVLITGCAGFIGLHLAEHYLRQGLNVVGIDNFLTGSKAHIQYLKENYSLFSFYEQDICVKWGFLSPGSFDLVFHLASPASVKSFQKYPLETLRANSVGLENALYFSLQSANNQPTRVIFASTSEIYGSPQMSPQSESYWGFVNPHGPRSCYDEAKRYGEALIYSFNRQFATTHGIVRIFNTYGPGMSAEDDRVVNAFIRNSLINKALQIFGSGNQTRSFCYIDDLIRGLDLYARSGLSEPINIGNATEHSVLQLAQEIISLTGSTSAIRHEPLPTDDPPQRRPDLSRARELLGYESTVPLDVGLKKTIDSLSASLR
jgi:nucleoside-diphosphate-sugar epimerase